MLASEFGYFGLEEFGVKPIGMRDLFTVDNEDAAEAFALLKLEGAALLSVEQRVAGPGGAGEDASGIAGGGHGSEALVVDAHLDILGFIDDQEAIRCGTNDTGGGVGGKVSDTGR